MRGDTWSQFGRVCDSQFRRFKWTTGSGSHSCRLSWAACSSSRSSSNRGRGETRDQRSDYRDADGYPQTHKARFRLELRDSQTGWRDLQLVPVSVTSSLIRVCGIFDSSLQKRKYFNLFIGHASSRFHFLPAIVWQMYLHVSCLDHSPSRCLSPDSTHASH